MRTAEFKWKRQRGVAAIIVGVTLTVLVGFLGLVVDTGRLYVTKTELQTAVDACALAGARYLGSPTQARLEMARDVGKAVGESGNRAVFQQESVLIDQPTFSDSIDGTNTSPGADAANMKYIQCVARKDSILNSFMQVLGADFRVSSVTAVAKASVVAGGSNCFLPVAMCKPAVNDPFEIGKWYYGRTSASNEQANVGNFRWIKLENEVDQTGADRFRDRLGGAACTEITSTTKVDGVPGQISSADPVFNTKFGLYKGNVEQYAPDLVGYAFVEPAFGSLKSGTFQKSGGDYANKTAYEAYEEILAGAPSQRGFQTPTYQDTTGNSANEITREVFRFSSGSSENFQILSGVQLADANSGSLQRRLVTLPIVDCDKLAQSNPNIVPNEGVACMFLLHPIGDTGSIAPSDPP
ncbi:MAG: pilus assembly protein TadG-related protein, partial [Quisquiliibacterium sp.]